MRTLFWQIITSLDGFAEGPNGELDWFVTGPDFDRYVERMLASIDTIVLGRKTYEALASYWPTAPNPEAFRMNALPKLVFSRTLATESPLRWQNASVAGGAPADTVAALKREPGRELGLFASADLAGTLAHHSLIDEYRVIVMPVVLGRGRAAFRNFLERRAFDLVCAEPLPSGAVIHTYRPRADQRE
jgi:dihydrofolate reductase